MVDVIGRAKIIVESQLDKTSFDADGNKIGSALKKGALVGVAALAGLATAGVKAGIAFGEAEAVSRKLNRTLDNMGQQSAGPAVEDLANKLMRLTAIDDEVIKGGETILATFSQVADSAGEVGGTFERATRLSLDMSDRFGSVDAAAKALGRALQDPEKGVAGLQRAGVKLTEAQKEQVASFLAVGDAAGAQNVVLDALEAKFKGTAEEGKTGAESIKTAFGELEEAFGHLLSELTGGDVTNLADGILALADAIDKFADSETVDGVAAMIDKLGELGDSDWAQKFEEDQNESLDGFIEWTERFQAEMDDSNAGFMQFVNGFRTGWSDLLTVTRRWGDDITDAAGKVWDDFLDDIRGVPGRISALGSKFKSAGGDIIREFVAGIGSGNFSASGIAEKIKAAINKALPDSITFFGGKGGIPAITVPIPQLATGARNFAGGLALVGEQGPELVALPRGSDVYTATETRNMGAGNVTIQQNFYGPTSGSEARQEIDWSLKYGTRFGAFA